MIRFVQAVAGFGFTEREARFLVHVMVYAGVFLERQYCAFAGIAHGQKTHDFLRKLIDRGYVTVITPGALHRGRLVHLQYQPLYEAIGEANNRNRRPASLGRMIERVMILDAVLADRRHLLALANRRASPRRVNACRAPPKLWHCGGRCTGTRPGVTCRYNSPQGPQWLKKP